MFITLDPSKYCLLTKLKTYEKTETKLYCPHKPTTQVSPREHMCLLAVMLKCWPQMDKEKHTNRQMY